MVFAILSPPSRSEGISEIFAQGQFLTVNYGLNYLLYYRTAEVADDCSSPTIVLNNVTNFERIKK